MFENFVTCVVWWCGQNQVLTSNTTYGSEDCLRVNVWQPAPTTSDELKPVMFFIYGGSDQFGEAEPYVSSVCVRLVEVGIRGQHHFVRR